MTPINPPDGYTVEWGMRYEDGRTIWWGTCDISEEMAREYRGGVFRYLGPAIPVQESDDEPRD